MIKDAHNLGHTSGGQHQTVGGSAAPSTTDVDKQNQDASAASTGAAKQAGGAHFNRLAPPALAESIGTYIFGPGSTQERECLVEEA